MLPGFSRTQCAPASIAFSASVWLKWMSAMTGIGDSATIVFSASTSCSRGTATRTMSAPASATRADLVHRRRAGWRSRSWSSSARRRARRRRWGRRRRGSAALRPCAQCIAASGLSLRVPFTGRLRHRPRAAARALASARSRRARARAPPRALLRAHRRCSRARRVARRRLRRARPARAGAATSTSPAWTSRRGPTTPGRSCRPTPPRACRSPTASSTSSTARA